MTRLTRRGFLAGSGAIVAGALVPARLAAQRASALTTHPVIDVHHHFLAPAFQKAFESQLNDVMVGWTPQRALDKMEATGLASAVLSLSNSDYEMPTPAQTAAVLRQSNEYGAQVVSDHPRRFGLLASLPLRDVDASLKELAYAFDTLHADGIGLMSHYGEARYMGDPALGPVYEEMNRRRVVAFIHPRAPFWQEARGQTSAQSRVTLPSMGATELPFDTTRAVMNMLANGIPDKYPNIRFILAHAGGTTPFLVQRATVLSGTGAKSAYAQTYQKLANAMSTFYYDVTNASARPNIKAVLELASASKLVFGTDVPYAGNGAYTRELLAELPHNGLTDAEVEGVRYRNAAALFPRLKQS